MAQWQPAGTEQRITDLVEAACGQGPQLIMRDDEVVAVMLSVDDYRRLVRQADVNFDRLLATSGLGLDDTAPAATGLSIAV